MKGKYLQYAAGMIVVMCFVVSPQLAGAIVGANVYNEAVYSYLDKIASAGLVKSYSPNQKPLSRYSAAKLVMEARSNIVSGHGGDLDPIVRELEREFKDEIDAVQNRRGDGVDVKVLDEAAFSWTAVNQPESAVPNNGLGSTTGMVQPLLSYKNGRHFGGYSNLYFSTSHWVGIGPYFSAYMQPQFYSGSDTNEGGLELFRGYAKTGAGNFEVQVGRDDLQWGPGRYGLFFSGNARALDMIRLTTPSTFRLPWLFGHLGQWRTTTFFSWLGTDFHPHNAILSGYRIDYQPFYWWDIGFDHAVVMGGTGAKDPSVTTAMGEYVGFLFKSGNSRASSNHQMGFDMSVRILPLFGTEVYGKVLLEDTQKEYGYMLANDASWLGGVYLPQISGLEKLSVRGEFIYSGQFSGRHSFYSDGSALDGKLFGYDAGPDTYSGMLESNYFFNVHEFIGTNFRYLLRSSDTYNLLYDATGNNNGIEVAVNGIDEHHMIFKVFGQKALSKLIDIYGEFGLDRTNNKSFTHGKDEFDFAAQVKFIFHDL